MYSMLEYFLVIYMKKVVIFGGGSGLSQVLKGLKQFPIDITAVVSVSDNGRSTGRLRKEMKQPAVGDITKVMIAMSNIDEDMVNLMNYRFTKSKTLGNHSIKNLLLTALLDIKGDFASSLPVMEDILDLKKGTIIPLTEDSVNLVGITENGKKIVGEEEITYSKEKIVRIDFSDEITVNPKVIKAVEEADLIIFSCGSLYTSIIPHLISKTLVNEINKSKAEKMYLCNLFSQPGETDDFKASDHIKMLENYLGKGKIDIIIANSEPISSSLAKKYATAEQKNPIELDRDKLEEMGVYVIGNKLYTIEDKVYRHDSLYLGYLIFSYLMEGRK